MKAIVIDASGGPEVLTLTDVPDPTPGRKDVVVRVEACGVCTHDVVTRNGTFRRGVKMPLIPGHEVSGIVVAVGADVRGFSIDDRVASVQRSHICGACRECRGGRETQCAEQVFLGDWGLNGGYAQYVCIEDDNLAHVPGDVDLQSAAIVACAVGTVLNGVRDVAKVRFGETVLITGAGGGLGVHAVQLAKLAGAQVIAQTTSPSKRDALLALGADEVVVHGRGEDFSPAVVALTGGVDVVIDNVGSQVFQSVRKSLASGGRWVLIGQLTGEFVPFNPAQIFSRNLSLLSAVSTTRQQLVECLELVRRGKIAPMISQTLPLHEAARAHQMVEAGQTLGRVVLRPDLSLGAGA